MTVSSNGRVRRFWVNVHLWVALIFAALLVPVSLSGALLTFHDDLDPLINPARYAVTEGQELSPSALLARAGEAVGPEFRPFVVRLPEGAGMPAIVNAREERRGEGARPRVVSVYLDPASGRALEVSEFRNSLAGILHRFHENLIIPEYNGRDVVGWTGVAMLIMACTGIYVWWPRGGFLRGLRWRRGPTLSYNLHHLAGFWISVPLAVVSLTGIYLGFPQQGRQLVSSVAPMTPQQRGGFGASPLRQTVLDADGALSAALNVQGGLRAAAIFIPTPQSQAWRVQFRNAGAPAATVMVDDKSGSASRIEPQSGDRIAQWIRWIHEGSNAGPIWRAIVFLCGVLPSVFLVTGVLIWLRSRAAKKAMVAPEGAVQTYPAE